MKKLLLFLFPLLMGCGQSEYTFVFEGPAEDMQDAISAAAQWNSCGVVRVTVVTRGEGDARIRKVAGYSDKPGRRAGAHMGKDLITYTEGGEYTSAFIAHEMGHIMGILHEDVPATALMTTRPKNMRVTIDDCNAL